MQHCGVVAYFLQAVRSKEPRQQRSHLILGLRQHPVSSPTPTPVLGPEIRRDHSAQYVEAWRGFSEIHANSTRKTQVHVIARDKMR